MVLAECRANSQIHRFNIVPENDSIKDIRDSFLLVMDSGRRVRPIDQAFVPVSLIT
jgi:hypothetical protein